MTVHFLPTTESDRAVRVAYTVGRRVGGAVVRNTWRRRLRAIAAEAGRDLPAGAYLIGLRPEVASLHFEELRERVTETMHRASGVRR